MSLLVQNVESIFLEKSQIIKMMKGIFHDENSLPSILSEIYDRLSVTYE